MFPIFLKITILIIPYYFKTYLSINVYKSFDLRHVRFIFKLKYCYIAKIYISTSIIYHLVGNQFEFGYLSDSSNIIFLNSRSNTYLENFKMKSAKGQNKKSSRSWYDHSLLEAHTVPAGFTFSHVKHHIYSHRGIHFSAFKKNICPYEVKRKNIISTALTT